MTQRLTICCTVTISAWKIRRWGRASCMRYRAACRTTIWWISSRPAGARTGKASDDDDEEDAPIDAPDEPDAEDEKGSGSRKGAVKVKLKPWNQRKLLGMGFDPSTDSAPEKLR